jgi:DNA primase
MSGLLRKIRKEFDYQSFLEVNFPIKYATNGEMRICCPKCGDSKFKCYVNNDKKYFNCFKCDFNSGNYDVFDFVAVSEGITRAQAMTRLSREHVDVAKSWEEIIDNTRSVEVDEPGEVSTIRVISSLPGGAVPLSREDESHQHFFEYLINRGFTEEDISDVGIHCVPYDNVFVYDSNKRLRGNISNRILFPVYGGSNQLVGWIARSIDGAEPKYFNAPDSELAKTLWPFVPSRNNRAIIVEGIIDALAVRKAGFSSYATFGKKITYDQVLLLKIWDINSVVFFWDKKDAKKEILKAVENLKLHFKEVLVPDFSMWPKDKDAGDTLNWEQGSLLLQDMLTNHLIDVNSLEFATWQLD